MRNRPNPAVSLEKLICRGVVHANVTPVCLQYPPLETDALIHYSIALEPKRFDEKSQIYILLLLLHCGSHGVVVSALDSNTGGVASI